MNVGIVGIGFMGMIHYLGYQKVDGIRVGAIVSRDEKKLAGDWRSIKGNFGPPGEIMDLSGVSLYREFDQLLADPSIDVVDICLPPSLHADLTVKALEAGKHVFCEKPIAVSTDDAHRMMQAAAATGKQLIIGHVLPMFAEYNFIVEAVRNQTYGKLLGGHFKRVISDPTWIPNFYDPQVTGGPLVDLHIHDAHFIRLLFGRPTHLFSRGRMRGEVAELATTQFMFADQSLSVSSVSGVINQQGRPFTHAYEIYFEQATVLFDFAVIDGQPHLAMPVTVLKADGTVEKPELPAGDAIDPFAAEIREVKLAIETGRPSALLAGEFAQDALLLCHKQTESIVQQKVVEV